MAVKERLDLLELIGRDARLRKVASTRGGEYAGPCPFCGGRDRFRVQPRRGRWWCRGCLAMTAGRTRSLTFSGVTASAISPRPAAGWALRQASRAIQFGRSRLPPR